MKYVKKMILVDYDVAMKFSNSEINSKNMFDVKTSEKEAQSHFGRNTLNSETIDNALGNIVRDKSLDDEEKLKVYKNLLAEYRFKKNSENTASNMETVDKEKKFQEKLKQAFTWSRRSPSPPLDGDTSVKRRQDYSNFRRLSELTTPIPKSSAPERTKSIRRKDLRDDDEIYILENIGRTMVKRNLELHYLTDDDDVDDSDDESFKDVSSTEPSKQVSPPSRKDVRTKKGAGRKNLKLRNTFPILKWEKFPKT